MIILYVLFYVSVAVLLSAVLYVVNIIKFRTKGEVFGYKFKVNSAEYKKYQARAGNKALVVALLVALAIALLMVVQAWYIARRHVADSMSTLIIGSLLVIFAGLWTLYTLASSSQGDSRSERRDRGKDNSWLV